MMRFLLAVVSKGNLAPVTKQNRVTATTIANMIRFSFREMNEGSEAFKNALNNHIPIFTEN